MRFAALLVVVIFAAVAVYAIVVRRREAKARRAWEAHCNAQALANDAALFAKRNDRTSVDGDRKA